MDTNPSNTVNGMHSHRLELRSLLTRVATTEREGVLDFIGEVEEDYCSNFGDQWQRFREVQLNSASATVKSRERFFAETGLAPSQLRDMIVLDAGCGAGRFAEIALNAGANVIAMDLSEATLACQKTLAPFPGERFLVIRANIFDLPLKREMFDLVFCLGVLQHTPDPLEGIRVLGRYVRPGGRLATWIYEKRVPYDLLRPKYLVRSVTKNTSGPAKLLLSKILVSTFFPLGWCLSHFGELKRLNFFLPYAARHRERQSLKEQWRYSVQDTYDWYGPEYDLPQSEKDVIEVMKSCGFVNVRRLPTRGMAIIGDKPQQ